MKKIILLLLTIVIFCSSCNNDDDENEIIIKEYALQEANNSGISGSVFFVRSSVVGEIFSIHIHLNDADLEGSYKANIYNNSLSNGGEIVFSIDDFHHLTNSDMMISSTSFHSSNQLVIQDEILNYQELIQFDGHIKIFNNDDPSIIVAEGNIGSNL